MDNKKRGVLLGGLFLVLVLGVMIFLNAGLVSSADCALFEGDEYGCEGDPSCNWDVSNYQCYNPSEWTECSNYYTQGECGLYNIDCYWDSANSLCYQLTESSSSCTSDADCGYLYCRTSTGECVQCLSNAHCSGDNNVCENYACKTYPYVSWENQGVAANLDETDGELMYKVNYAYPYGVFDSYVEYCCYNHVAYGGGSDLEDQAYWDCVDRFSGIDSEFNLNDFFGNHASADNELSRCLADGMSSAGTCTGFYSFSDGTYAYLYSCLNYVLVSCTGDYPCSSYTYYIDECLSSSYPDCSTTSSVSSLRRAYYRDSDGDGYGSPYYKTTDYSRPVGYVSDFSDCDDNDAEAYFGATEICNGEDTDCNGVIDNNGDCVYADCDDAVCEGEYKDEKIWINPDYAANWGSGYYAIDYSSSFSLANQPHCGDCNDNDHEAVHVAGNSWFKYTCDRTWGWTGFCSGSEWNIDSYVGPAYSYLPCSDYVDKETCLSHLSEGCSWFYGELCTPECSQAGEVPDVYYGCCDEMVEDSNGLCCPSGTEWDGAACVDPIPCACTIGETRCIDDDINSGYETCADDCMTWSTTLYVRGYIYTNEECVEPTLLGECDPGCVSDEDCGAGLSCETTLGGSNLCVPTGNCAQSGDPCSVVDGTVKTVGECDYQCGLVSPGIWGELSCQEVPSAHWSSSSSLNILSSAYEGNSIRLILENADASSNSFTIYKEGASYTTRTSSYDATGDYTYNVWTVPTAGSDTSYTFGIDFEGTTYTSGTLSVTVPPCSDDGDCDTGEVCDGGACRPGTYCGDGDVDLPNDNGVYEECDNGTSNSNTCSATYGNTCAYCTPSTCDIGIKPAAYCGGGDGACNEPDETCGDTNTAPECNSDCGACPVEKQVYWKDSSGNLINSESLTVEELSSGTKQYTMILVNPSASPGSFELKENDEPYLNQDVGTWTGSYSGSSTYYYTWTPSVADFENTKTWDESDGIWEFFFRVDSMRSDDLVLTLVGDLPVCGDGKCEETKGEDETNCPDDCTVDPCLNINSCSDYETQEECEADACVIAEDLGDNQYSECYWNGTDCIQRTVTVTPDGFVIGACDRSYDSADDTCDDDNALTYSWSAVWNWDENNNYTSNDNPPEGYDFEAGDDGYWHLTDGSDLECRPGSRTIPCPAQVKLPFFDDNWKNIVIALIVIGLIYLTILELRKNRKKVQKIEKKKKESSKKSKRKSKKKK